MVVQALLDWRECSVSITSNKIQIEHIEYLIDELEEVAFVKQNALAPALAKQQPIDKGSFGMPLVLEALGYNWERNIDSEPTD